MIKYIQVFGERRSGTNYLTSLIKSNFKGVALTSDFGGKHWYIKDHSPRGEHNTTTDNQAIRPISQSADTLFLIIFRNPYDWLRSLQTYPFHADGHWALGFSEFIRKPWVSSASEKLHESWSDTEKSDYFIEEARNVLALRSKKILHLTALADTVSNICFINYEALAANTDIIGSISNKYDIKLQHDWVRDNPVRVGSGNKPRVGFTRKTYPEISKDDLLFIRNNLDWEIESSIGYKPDYLDQEILYDMDNRLSQFDRVETKITPEITSVQSKKEIDESTMSSIIDLTINIKNMSPLYLACEESEPVLKTLFKSLMANTHGERGGEILFLQLGNADQRTLYFRSGDLISIETDPPLSASFMQGLVE